MEDIIENKFCTPTKLYGPSYFFTSQKDSSDSSISGIYNPESPSNQKNILANDSLNDESNSFHSNGACVTSTPVSRSGNLLQLRKSSVLKTKRYSLKQGHDNQRVDISNYIKVIVDQHNIIENLSNDIHISHIEYKYSRLNSIYRDLISNEALIYMYPSLFNSEIMKSKFLFQSNFGSVAMADHRYDCKRYILKIGDKFSHKFLSPLNQRIIHEIRILKLLADHPNIVEYCDSWIENDRMHLQLKYISGGSLQDFLMINKNSLDNNNLLYLSKTSAIILLAHIGSVLAYMHDVLCIAHGAITTYHILIDCVGYINEVKENEHSKFYKVLTSDDDNINLRFKLCDFGICEIKESRNMDSISNFEDPRGNDILSLGMILIYCLYGHDHVSVHDSLYVHELKLSGKISDDWIHIIMNMCNKDQMYRWTAKSIINLEIVDKFILPEARYYLPDYTIVPSNCRYLINEPTIHFVKPYNLEFYPEIPMSDDDHYWVPSKNTKEVVDIASDINTIAASRSRREECLYEIHNKHLKFREFKLSSHIDSWNDQEKCILEYPVLFNSDVTSSKFSVQTLISETKLSKIYIADHRYDGDSYILKVGLQSLTFAMSDSSREIINEMRILKLIGKHPNIVGYCDCWIEDEKFHLQLKYIPGGSLYDFTQGHSKKFLALSDTSKSTHKFCISSQCAYVLLAHMISALVYLHDELEIFHGDIKPSNILVELTGFNLDLEYMNNAKLFCQNVLMSEEINMNLRFKLCDFGRSGPTVNINSMEEGDGRYLPNLSERFAESDYHIRATSRDIFSLGLSIYDCFGGVIDQESSRDIRAGCWRQWPQSVTRAWQHIILNLCHIDPCDRWTAKDVIVLDPLQPFIVAEAHYHVATSGRYIAANNKRDSLSLDSVMDQSKDDYKQQQLGVTNVNLFSSDDMDVSF